MKLLILSVLLLCSFPAFAETKWTGDSGAGIVVTEGNTHTQNFNVISDTKYLWDVNTLELRGTYLRATSYDQVTSLNWMAMLRYERALNPLTNVFLGQSVEGDQFAGILQRYNTDLGVKYFFYKLEKDFTWFGEGGYRFTREHDTTGLTKSYQKARLYSEAEKFWSPTTSTKLWVEYVPNFTVTRQWLLNSEASLTSQINTVFALKTAYGLRYNNAPPVATAQKADSQLSTSLVAKF